MNTVYDKFQLVNGVTCNLAFPSQKKQSYTAVLQDFSTTKWVLSLLPTDRDSNPAETTLSTNIVEASKRAFSKPIRKMEHILTATIIRLCRRFAGRSYTLKGLRTTFIFPLGFKGLFKVSELLELKARAITLKKEHLEIFIPRSKTDQSFKEIKCILQKRMGQPAHKLCFHVFVLSQV